MRNRSQMQEPAPIVEIDLDAICANFRALCGAAPGAECAPVVKCDGYGLGAERIARAIAEREGAASFFVTYVEEGVRLRNALAPIAEPTIYVFNGPHETTLTALRAARLVPVLNSLHQARLWASAAAGRAALHADTGMNRLGAPLPELQEISRLGLAIDLFLSHLACGSQPGHAMNMRQRETFIAAGALFPGARKSLAASGGALLGHEFHFDLIRPGIALYGASPFDAPDARLRPVATLTAPVIQLRDIRKGESCGYGAALRFAGPAKLAVVALGYGDGFLRAGGDRGAAWLAGAHCPIAGRVSMDLIVLDVSAAPEPVRLGDRAEFFGPRRLIEDAAAAAGTIPYELLTALGERVSRRYVCGGE